MATLDIFKNPAFGLMAMITAVERMPFKPSYLSSFPGLWTPKPLRTEAAPVEIKDGVLSVIPTSERGSPAPRTDGGTNRRMVHVDTPRLAETDTVRSSEIAGVRAYGSVSELEQVMDVIVERMAGPTGLLSRLDLTGEFHKLGAIDGVVYDKDGSIIVDWFDTLKVNRPDYKGFDFTTCSADGEGKFRIFCRELKRDVMRSLGGLALPRLRFVALCGDAYFDGVADNAETRSTYLRQQDARELRTDDLAFDTLDFGGILWVNYQGTEDGKVGVPSGEARLFPVLPGMFEIALSPGEMMTAVNMPGKKVYPMIIPDPSGRQMSMELDIYSYPLHICKRPEALRRLRIGADGPVNDG